MDTQEIKTAVVRLTQIAEQIDREVNLCSYPYGHASLIITGTAVTVYLTIGTGKIGGPVKVTGESIHEVIYNAHKTLSGIARASDLLAQTLGLEVARA